jgi:hypothetical protein
MGGAVVAKSKQKSKHKRLGLVMIICLLSSNGWAFGPLSALKQAFLAADEFGGRPSSRSGFEDLLHLVISRYHFNNFEGVMRHFHSGVEEQTEVLYLINSMNPTDGFTLNQNQEERQSWVLAGSSLISEPIAKWALHVPPQHMLILKKQNSNLPLFERDAQGAILGLHPNALVYTLPLNLQKSGVVAERLINGKDFLRVAVDYSKDPRPIAAVSRLSGQELPWVPVSTGRTGMGIRSFSGIYLINEKRTIEKRFSNNTPRDPMQNSVYIMAEYDVPDEGRLREAWVAIHGTPEGNWHLLGRERSSAGCIRVQTDFSKWNREFLFNWATPPVQRANRTWTFSGAMYPNPNLVGEIRSWDPKKHYPPGPAAFRSLPTRTSLKVKVVLFNGYQQNSSTR